MPTKDKIAAVAMLLAFGAALAFLTVLLLSCGESVIDDGDDDDTSTWDDWEWDGSTGDDSDTDTTITECVNGFDGWTYCECTTIGWLQQGCVHTIVGNNTCPPGDRCCCS